MLLAENLVHTVAICTIFVMSNKTLLALPAAAACLILAGCSSSATPSPAAGSSTPTVTPVPGGLPDTATITYSQNNGTVAPEYQKTMVLEVNKDGGKFTAITKDETTTEDVAINETQWDELLMGWNTVAGIESTSGTCVGGPTYTFKVTDNSTTIKDVTLDTCDEAGKQAVDKVENWLNTLAPTESAPPTESPS